MNYSDIYSRLIKLRWITVSSQNSEKLRYAISCSEGRNEGSEGLTTLACDGQPGSRSTTGLTHRSDWTTAMGPRSLQQGFHTLRFMVWTVGSSSMFPTEIYIYIFFFFPSLGNSLCVHKCAFYTKGHSLLRVFWEFKTKWSRKRGNQWGCSGEPHGSIHSISRHEEQIYLFFY